MADKAKGGVAKNLKTWDSETAKALGAKGGKASGESRRRKANLRKAANEILSNQKVTVNGEMVSAEEAMILAMLQKAIAGDVGAFKALMGVVGVSEKSDLDEKEQKARIKKLEAEALLMEERAKVGVSGNEEGRVIVIDDIEIRAEEASE